jgi:putative transposase
VDGLKVEFCGIEKKQNKMKRSRFSEEQIIGILREAQAGKSVKAVCGEHNVSEATFYNWKKKYGGMDVSEARRLRALEEENGRLKRIIADLSVQNHVLKEVNAKKW